LLRNHNITFHFYSATQYRYIPHYGIKSQGFTCTCSTRRIRECRVGGSSPVKVGGTSMKTPSIKTWYSKILPHHLYLDFCDVGPKWCSLRRTPSGRTGRHRHLPRRRGMSLFASLLGIHLIIGLGGRLSATTFL
jgi:hypothetical protein